MSHPPSPEQLGAKVSLTGGNCVLPGALWQYLAEPATWCYCLWLLNFLFVTEENKVYLRESLRELEVLPVNADMFMAVAAEVAKEQQKKE